MIYEPNRNFDEPDPDKILLTGTTGGGKSNAVGVLLAELAAAAEEGGPEWEEMVAKTKELNLEPLVLHDDGVIEEELMTRLRRLGHQGRLPDIMFVPGPPHRQRARLEDLP